eukprot:12413146-Alexandrium_andersonii.AAC.1
MRIGALRRRVCRHTWKGTCAGAMVLQVPCAGSLQARLDGRMAKARKQLARAQGRSAGGQVAGE